MTTELQTLEDQAKLQKNVAVLWWDAKTQIRYRLEGRRARLSAPVHGPAHRHREHNAPRLRPDPQ